MRHALFALVALFIFLSSENTAKAVCKVDTSDAFQQNVLIDIGMAEFGAGAAQVQSAKILNYKKGFTGGVGGVGCFAHLYVTGLVELIYTDVHGQLCNSRVQVERTVLNNGASNSTNTTNEQRGCEVVL
jgi:hypothetical protein